MAKRSTDSTVRKKFVTFLLLLLPGFMFVGLLAPAAVTVTPEPESESVGPVYFRGLTPLRPPMLVPRAIASAVLADVSIVDPQFSNARLLAQEAPRELELPDVAAAADDDIALEEEDDVEDFVTDTLFDESIEQPVLAVDLTPLWDPAIFDVIPGVILRDGYSMYDDFHGSSLKIGGAPLAPFVVPEPGTGALLALGLLTLALRAHCTRA